MRLPAAWKRSLEIGRLLLLSPFEVKYRRVTADLAKRRNEMITAMANKVCFIHVNPGGDLEALRDRLREKALPRVMNLKSGSECNLSQPY